MMPLQEMIDKADIEPKKIVGNFLLKRLETDIDARNNWERFSKTLDGCWEYITRKARVAAVHSCCCVSDETVFNWALEYLMDVKTYNVDGNIVTGTVTATGDDAERWKARETPTQSQSSPNPVPMPSTSEAKRSPAKPSETEGNRGKSAEISTPKPTKLYTAKPKKKENTDFEQLTLF